MLWYSASRRRNGVIGRMAELVLISTVSSHRSTHCFASSSTRMRFNPQCRQSAVAEFMRYYGTHLIELFGFFAIELFKFGTWL
jgi:hypothetical protein